MKKVLKIGLIFIMLFTINLFAKNSTQVTKVVVKKSQKVLLLMNKNRVIKKFHIVMGANPKGHKQKEGDERTPEGRYILDYKNPNSKFYKSIHISYPNKKDIKRAKRLKVNPGGAIFIHGQKNGWGWLYFISKYFNWTDGCIALSNKEMDFIYKNVKVGTPIEIKP